LRKEALHLLIAAIILLGLLGLGLIDCPDTVKAEDSTYFSQTGHTVSGKFLNYWRSNGGLAAFGYPITDAQDEPDSENSQVYLTQWFERNSFQLHPENAGTKYEVELGLLGKRLTQNRPENDPAFQPASSKSGFFFFPQTHHNVSSLFYTFWQNNGSLDRLGFPIDEEQRETDPATGQVFQLQWFERARLEFHPENQPPYHLELGLLGNEIKKSSPSQILQLFYKSISNQTYPQAYNYWDNPTQNLPPYSQWAQGYADTAAVTLTTGDYRIDVGAGNAYAPVPVVLVATHLHTGKQTFYGCYITHKVNIQADQTWFISRASIKEDLSGASVSTLLLSAANICANI